MLNLFNNSNNFSLLDNNLLSYGVLMGSVTIIGISLYYFTGYLTNVYTNKTIHTLPDTETFTQRLVENLDNYQKLNLDNKVPTMSNFVDTVTQTPKTDTIKLVDSSVQTDPKMLWDYMNELLYNNGTPITSLGDMEPEVFADLLAKDPQGPAYLEHIQEWVDNVPSILASNSGTHSSEINFLRQVLETMRSNLNSPVVEINKDSTIDLITQNNNNILNLIQRKIEYLHNVNINIEELSKITYYYEALLQESKLNEYVVYCTEMCSSQIFPLM